MADSILTFTIERSTDNVNWSPLMTVPGNVYTFTDTAPPPTAYYRVTGHTALGFDIPYNVIQVAPPTTGAFAWQQPIKGTTTADFVDIGGIAVDASNNTYVVGNFQGTVKFGTTSKTSVGGWDLFVAKYDSAGHLLWVNQYGDVYDQFGTCVAIDSDQNILVGGHFAGTMVVANVDGSNATTLSEVFVSQRYYSEYDIFVLKLSPSGNKIWARSFGGAGTETCYGIAVGPDKHPVIVGNYTIPQTTQRLDFGCGPLSNQGAQDFYVAKLDKDDGHCLWSIHHGLNDGSFSYAAYANGVAVDSAGDVGVIGYISGGTIDLGIGGTQSAHGGSDIFICKYSGANGNAVWAKLYGGTLSDLGRAITFNSVNDAIVTGGFMKSVDFGGFGISTPLTLGTYYTGVFVARMDAATGATNFAYGFGGQALGEDIGYAVAVDSEDNILLTGTVRGSYINWGGGPKYSVDGTLNIFVTKLNRSGQWVWDKRITTGATLNYGKAIRADSAKNVLTAGYFAGTINFGGDDIAGNSDHTGYLVKFSP